MPLGSNVWKISFLSDFEELATFALPGCAGGFWHLEDGSEANLQS